MLNRVVSLLGMLTIAIAVACGPSAPLTPAVASSPMPPEPAAGARPAPTSAPAATPTALPTTTAAPTPVAMAQSPTGYPDNGPASLQQRIARSHVIARVRLASVRQVVESFSRKGYQADLTPVDTTPVFGPALEYTFDVREYLKGSGGAQVVGIALDTVSAYPTEEEAEAANLDYLSTRDTQWDGREAIVFLMGWREEFGNVPVSVKQTGRYKLGNIRASYGRDTYTIASAFSKNWLPAVTTESTAAEYLLDVPDPYGLEPTLSITLTALKAEVATIDAEIAAGDGTSAYEFCIYWKYVEKRSAEFGNALLEEFGHTFEPTRLPFGSGLAAGSLVDTSEMYFRTTNLSRTWMEGDDAGLFEARGMGRVAAVRPLPAGEYHFTYITRLDRLDPCDATPSDAEKRNMQNVVVASAPAGVLHEAFFDPVTVGNTVGAAGANGVLKPVSFTASNGASATLHSIVWEAPSTGSGVGTVKVRVVPWSSLAGKVLDFIELDGTVSTSLNVSSSAVEVASDTLTWQVSSQPWEDGDKLMVRIREAAPYAPAPHGLRSTAVGSDSISLSWDSVRGVTGYVVERRVSGEARWETVDAAVTEKTRTVSGLSCGTSYEFRVGAYGDGTWYEGVTGPGGYAMATATTAACSEPPAFDAAPYSFEVSEDASVGSTVGTVSATDPDQGDTVAYSIVSGNEVGKFAIGASTGIITLAATLDYETASSYTLTVQADDGNGGTATTSVQIGVLDVLDTPPPAPQGLSVSLSEGGFLLSWNAVSGADLYEAQHRVAGASEAAWTSLDAAASTSASFTPDGGPACGSTYEFRVRARGDGADYTADWGEVSETVSVTTGGCSLPPVFGAAAYSFSVNEDASVGSTVGTVSATDPDQGDTVAYSIVSGNDAGKFAIGASTGIITLAGTLDYDTASSYTLTVQADDGNGGTATATVRIGVVEVADTGAPVFGAGAYAFSIIEGAAVGSTVGAVSATDPNEGDTVAYSMTAGNEAGKFSMASDTGRITLAGTLDHATASSYTLTVQAGDGKGGTATATVTVSVELASCSNGTAVASPSDNPKLVEDCLTLLSSRDALEGTVVLNWSSDTPIARWKGVGVAGTPGRLQSLSLSGLGLDGTVPSGLGDLAELRTLNLRDNELTGSIPSELGGLSKLTHLYLSDNRLSSGIPASLGDLLKLGTLNLEYNRLSGGIPESLGKLKGLHQLVLGANRLTGTIPTVLSSLSNLQTLDLAENQLSGTIPVGLGGLGQLRYLSLGGNALTGSVPTELGSLSNLQYLYLDQNDLTGGIPTQLGSLARLEVLSLYGNQLSGGIPSELGGLSNLEELALSRNALTGSIPSELEGLSNLAYLTLSGNRLTGCIPAGLRDVPTNDLDRLELAYCNAAPK